MEQGSGEAFFEVGVRGKKITSMECEKKAKTYKYNRGWNKYELDNARLSELFDNIILHHGHFGSRFCRY
jgi:hypothetical protein